MRQLPQVRKLLFMLRLITCCDNVTKVQLPILYLRNLDKPQTCTRLEFGLVANPHEPQTALGGITTVLTHPLTILQAAASKLRGA